jgi:lipopolysaccharide export system protein LptA
MRARASRLRLAAAFAAAVAAAATPASRAAAQQPPASRCILQFEPLRDAPPRTTLTRLPSGKYDVFQGGGVRYRCQDQPITLEADSAEYYGDRDVLYLIGSVHYVEPRATVDSRRMTYFKPEERILAEGDVHAVLQSGTTMNGPLADYFRQTPARPRARLVATGRPRMSLAQRDSSGRAAEPVQLVADRVTLDGDSLVFAGGRVDVTRTDVQARGDSAYLDSGREFARLMRSPAIAGRGQRPFTLTGGTIDLFSRERQLQRVLSKGQARAVSEDMTLTSDTIDMRVTAGRLERAYAWGRQRAHVVSPDNDILADSLDVVMPAQHLREVRAVRKAFAQSRPDSTRIRTAERDWLRGDTIVARFDSVPSADTTTRPRVREVVAVGAASSYYHIPAQHSDPAHPSINYVKGRDITIAFRDQQVDTVKVTNQAAGVYLEPATDSTRTPRAGGRTTAGAAGGASAGTGADGARTDTSGRGAPARPSSRPANPPATRGAPSSSGTRP